MAEIKNEFVITREEVCSILGLLNNIEDESANAISYRRKEKRAHAVVRVHHCSYGIRNILNKILKQDER